MIFESVALTFDSNRKCNAEENALALFSVKYLFSKISSDEELRQIMTFKEYLLNLFDKSRKTSIKNAVIYVLGRILLHQSILHGEKASFATMFWQDIPDLYKTARKWSSADDLKESALNLMTTILVNSSADFFNKNFESFVNNDLCSKGKVRDFAYTSMLQLLCGRFCYDTRTNVRSIADGTYARGHQFGSQIRPENEDKQVMSSRVKLLADLMFYRRSAKYPVEEEYLNITADFALQIAAFDVEQGKKLIEFLLDTKRVDSAPWSHYVGVKALRIILDSASGFQKFALCKNDAEYELFIFNLPQSMERSLVAVYEMVDVQIGVGALGSNGYVFEQIMQPGIKPPQASDYWHHEPSLVETLFRNVDKSKADLTEESTYPSNNVPSMMKNNSAINLISSASALNINDTDPRESSSLGRQMKSQSVYKSGLSSFIESPSSPTRNSLGNSMIFYADPDISLTGVTEANDKVSVMLHDCFRLLEDKKKNVSKYIYSSPLHDNARVKRNKGIKLKGEQKASLKTLTEIIKLLKFMPGIVVDEFSARFSRGVLVHWNLSQPC
jgi:Cell morphogenesis N-terminal